MGFLSSAYNWLHDKLNTGLLASAPPSSISLNSSPSHTSSTIKMDLSKPDPIKVYNPGVSALVPDVDPLIDDTQPNNPSPKPYRSSASGLTPSNVAEVDYLNAELAKHYGMNLSTAYQEALSNTSYQRAVKDMKAAGLNPSVMFGSGRAQGASSGIYASGASSGSGSRSRGYSSSNGKLFSSSAYSAIQAIGGLIGLATTKRPDGFWIGSQSAKGAMGLFDSISKFK